MKRVVKLTEQDLYRIVKRVIAEQDATQTQPAATSSTGQQTTSSAATTQIVLGGGFRINTAYPLSQIVPRSENLEYKGMVYQLNKSLSDVVTTLSKVQSTIKQGQDIWGPSEIKPTSFCETLLMKDRGIYIKDSKNRPTSYAFKCGNTKGNDPSLVVFYKDPTKTWSSQG